LVNYQQKTGVNPGYVPLAVGIGHFGNIVAYVEQALTVANAWPFIFPCQNMVCGNSCSPYFTA